MGPILQKSEVDLYRSQTKGCARLAHVDSAGSSLPQDVVVNAVKGLKEQVLVGGSILPEGQIGNSCRELTGIVQGVESGI